MKTAFWRKRNETAAAAPDSIASFAVPDRTSLSAYTIERTANRICGTSGRISMATPTKVVIDRRITAARRAMSFDGVHSMASRYVARAIAIARTKNNPLNTRIADADSPVRASTGASTNQTSGWWCSKKSRNGTWPFKTSHVA